MVNWLVPQIDLQQDGSAVVTVQVGDIGYDSWAEISGYIIQDDTWQGGKIQTAGALVPFSAIQWIPKPPDGATSVSVKVNVAAAGLTRGDNVKVITRVAEVQIWPTVLKDGANTGTWLAVSYP